ncbi:MAG: hypothetical protein Q9209_007548 [Squamulea sp. 1 TL-2023]
MTTPASSLEAQNLIRNSLEILVLQQLQKNFYKMPLPIPSSAAPTHESPSNSSTLSTPASEIPNTNPSSKISQTLDCTPESDVGASQGSSAGKQMKSQVEEAVDKVFERREGEIS